MKTKRKETDEILKRNKGSKKRKYEITEEEEEEERRNRERKEDVIMIMRLRHIWSYSASQSAKVLAKI